MRLPQVGARAGTAALCALLVLDVVLVAAALNSARAEVPNGGARISGAHAPVTGDGTAGTGAAASGGAVAAAAPTSASTAGVGALQPEPLRRGLIAVDADTAWRFTVGSCASGGSTLGITDDGGRTWQPRAAPFDAAVRLRVRPDLTAFVVGADKASGCKPMIRQSSGRAADWGPGAPVSDAWYRDPSDPAVVGTPLGEQVQPCGGAHVIDLTVRDDGADALCAGGEVLRSSDGSEWSRRATAEGALALAAAADGASLVVLGGADGCAGLALADAASPDDPLGCFETGLGDVEAGTVTLSVVDEDVWLGVGAEVYRSSGPLEVWRQS